MSEGISVMAVNLMKTAERLVSHPQLKKVWVDEILSYGHPLSNFWGGALQG